MPVLENATHEAFAHALITTNFDKAKAYKLACPNVKDITARTAGNRLWRSVPAIQERINELLEMMYGDPDAEGRKVLHELDAIAHAKITDIVSFKDGCLLVKSEDEIPEELHGAIAQVEEIPTENGPRIKVRMHDKMKALELKGRYAKLFTDKVENTGAGLQFADDFGTPATKPKTEPPKPSTDATAETTH